MARKVKVYRDTRPPKDTFGLMVEEDNGSKWVLRGAPNNWETEKAAVNWGRKQGYDVEVNGKKVKTSVRNSRKRKKEIKKMFQPKKATAKKAPAKKTTAKKAPARKATPKKTKAKRMAPKKTVPKKTTKRCK